MVGLIDIGPLSEKVPVGGAEVEVFGVSAEGVFSLLARFPELRAFFEKRGTSPDRLLACGGEIVAAVLAAGTGAPNSPEAEAIARRLPIAVQAALLEPIWRLTFPNGVGAAMDQITRLMAPLGAGGGPSIAAPATRSRKGSRR